MKLFLAALMVFWSSALFAQSDVSAVVQSNVPAVEAPAAVPPVIPVDQKASLLALEIKVLQLNTQLQQSDVQKNFNQALNELQVALQQQLTGIDPTKYRLCSILQTSLGCKLGEDLVFIEVPKPPTPPAAPEAPTAVPAKK